MAHAVGRVSIKVSDCLPYLKCFNVEDIVNIRGHFSSQKYLRDTEATKGTANEGEGEGNGDYSKNQ